MTLPRALLSIAILALAGNVQADSFNASMYINLLAPDGSFFETSLRRVLAPGEIEDLKGGDWGVAVSFEEVSPDTFRVIATVLKQTDFDGPKHWVAYTLTENEGVYDAPLEVRFTEGDLELEMAYFVSAK